MHALRAYFFATYAALGALLPLLAVALAARGLRPSQYAWLLALMPLSRLLAPPLWGALADRYVGTIRLLRLNTLISALAMAALAASTRLAVTLPAFAVWAFASSSLNPLAEAGTYRALGAGASGFGYVRVFGSVGFVASALGLGLTGVDAEVRAPFALATAIYLAGSVVAFRMRESAAPARAQLRPALARLARRPDARLLWAAAVLYYFAHGTFDAYFGPFARTLEGVRPESISKLWALGVVCEVVALLCMPRLLESRLRSGLLLLAAAVAALRWILIAGAHGARDLWLQQPLHAITFGVWYLAFVHENQSRAEPSVRATVQGVASACLGLGMLLATLLGGYVLESLGGRALFRLATGAALASLALYAVRWVRLRREPRA